MSLCESLHPRLPPSPPRRPHHVVLQAHLLTVNVNVRRGRPRGMFAYDWASGFVSPFRGADGAAYATPEPVITALLDAVTAPNPSLIVDLGSGDGRLVLAAARRGLRARGIELDAGLVAASRAAAQAEALDDLATFEEASILEVPLPRNADICFVAYLLPAAVQKLARRLAADGHAGRLFVLRWSVDLPELTKIARHKFADGWFADEFRCRVPSSSCSRGGGGEDAASYRPAASLLIMTCPSRAPERLPLLHRTLCAAIGQRLREPSDAIEVIVVDDRPACGAWGTVVAARRAATSAGVRLRYVALPPDPETGVVNMRLKRNVALLLCTGRVAIFFDDDDWRSPESVQTQLDAMSHHRAHACAWQVHHVCEIDARARAVRYFDTPDGGGIFSRRLGNPGSCALRREVWETNSSLGFPDTPCEDVDYMRILLSESPLLEAARPLKCSFALIDGAELTRQRCLPGFMTVRLLGFAHVWPLQPLQGITPMPQPPPCMPSDDVNFLSAYCERLHPPVASVLPDDALPPLPADAMPSDHLLAEAARRMAAANSALLMLSAYLQAQRPLSAGCIESGFEAEVVNALATATATLCAPLAGVTDATATAEHTAAFGAAMRAMDSIRGASTEHRAAHADPAEGAAVAQRMVDLGAIGHVASLLRLAHTAVMSNTHGSLGLPTADGEKLAAACAELAEEILFRTSSPASTHATPAAPQLLDALGAALACPYLKPEIVHAAAAGAVQHLLTHACEQRRLVSLPASACVDSLVAALARGVPVVSRRAAGALCNACADDEALAAIVNAGAPAALSRCIHAAHESAAVPPAALPVYVRTLERMCSVSASAREQAAAALPEGELLSTIAQLLASHSHASTRACASKLVAAFSLSESRHWKPPMERLPPRQWPVDSIVYYTGVALEAWGPERLESGLGGSETAVLQLACRWANAEGGREVAVYLRMAESGGCAERMWRGVRLLDVATFNPLDTFGRLIVWRSLEILDEPIRSAATLLDLHDMPRVHEISPKRLARVDVIMLKSDFQRSALPPSAQLVPSLVIPNGVDEDLIARVQAEGAATGASRELRVLYTSSYDRGLEHMLKHGWPRIVGAIPHATLHLYYGWRTHELLHPTSTWRQEMQGLIASYDSVCDHGRVGQLELLRAKAASPLLYYVGDWPEIDCIAVREAAMLGCVPLTSTVAVFGDVAKDYCVKVSGDPTMAETQHQAADVAIRLLSAYEATGALPEVRTDSLREETWARVAARWLEFFDGPRLATLT